MINCYSTKANRSLFFYLSFYCFLITAGCSGDGIVLLDYIESRLELIDRHGLDANQFELDSTLIFRLSLDNTSSHDTIIFTNGDLLPNPDLFMVYKYRNNKNNEAIKIGTPFIGWGGDQLLMIIKIPPKGRFCLSNQACMDNSNITPLTRGSYFTDFNFYFRLNHLTKSYHIHRDFYIQ